MDELTRPKAFSPELYIYAEKHNVFGLFQFILERLLVERPQNPLDFLYELLKRGYYEVPMIFVLGPPVYERKVVCSMLCLHLHTIHLNWNSLQELSHTENECDAESNDTDQNVPENHWIDALKSRLEKPDCVQHGWVLEGFPRTRQQSFLLRKAGIFPSHIVILEESETSHSPFVGSDVFVINSPDWKELMEFRFQSPLVRDLYQGTHLKTFPPEPKPDILADKVLQFVRTKPLSLAPYIPRILLFGPEGSGRRTIANMLNKRFNLVTVDFQEVLKESAMNNSPRKTTLQEILQTDDLIPDAVLAEIVAKRLQKNDCTSRGWVMYNFPLNTAQAKYLVDLLRGHQINRAIFLEADFEVCVKRVEYRRLDPETGQVFDLKINPPPYNVPLDRLIQRPDDSRAFVMTYYRLYQGSSVTLKIFFGRYLQDDLVCTLDSNGSLTNTFEKIQSIILGPLKRKIFLPENDNFSTKLLHHYLEP